MANDENLIKDCKLESYYEFIKEIMKESDLEAKDID